MKGSKILKNIGNKHTVKKESQSNAIIILLYGASSSGKTTICQKLRNLNSDLIIDGTDLANERLKEQHFEKIRIYINENKTEFANLEYAQAIFTTTEICFIILNEKVNIHDIEVSLMFDFDTISTSDYENILEEKFGSGYLIEKKAIAVLRHIAHGYVNNISLSLHKEIFKLAINNSRKNISTILDVAPNEVKPGQFMIDIFLNQIKEMKHNGPTHIALLHCPIPTLLERIKARNCEALTNNNLQEIRNEPFPFRQYSILFGLSDKNPSVSLGTLNLEDAKKAITTFSNNTVEIEEIMMRLGFTTQCEKITISPKCDYDHIYDSDKQTTEEIAVSLSKLLKSNS